MYDLEQEVLAKFLGIEIDELKLWSDGSFTIGNNDREEYIVISHKNNSYMEFLGIQDGFNIYKN